MIAHTIKSSITFKGFSFNLTLYFSFFNRSLLTKLNAFSYIFIMVDIFFNIVITL